MDSATSSSGTLSGVLLPEQDSLASPASPLGLPQPLRPTRAKNPQPGIPVRNPPGKSQINTLDRSRMVICERGGLQAHPTTTTLTLLVDLVFVPNFLTKNPGWRGYHARTRARMELLKSMRLEATTLVLKVENWRQGVPHGSDFDLTTERHRAGFNSEGRFVHEWGIHTAALIRRRDEFKADLTDFINEQDRGVQIQKFIDGYLSITVKMYTDKYRAPPADYLDLFGTQSVQSLNAIPDI
ncbi:MAG: hypothetical protein Q9208_007222 [Pyrenodesmia sp. 3 TL-2023]